MSQSVLAVAAHPDDIEFVMAGTLLRLIEAGWEAHYFNIANGCCGSTTLGRDECARIRLEEARQAARELPAQFYSPIRNDLEIFYDSPTLAEVAAVVRRAKPQIVLTHALSDYMEDHQNAARLAVGGAFCRGMPNFSSIPPQPEFSAPIAVYHAQPHGNRTPTKQLVTPEFFIDISDFMERKRSLLACHRSQDEWLDSSQGMSSYLKSMEQLSGEVGQMSSKFDYAEGWTQHIHLGLAQDAAFNPLAQALGHCLA